MRGERVTVVLGVTGCIAAYKACELARALIREDVRVKVVMTDAATRFVGATTFRALTDEPVVTSLWEESAPAAVHHVSLADEADVFVVAPCTANVMAKLAHGVADDMLTTAALATEAPLVIAPAMNTHMWRDPATRANAAALRERGAIIIEPATGTLACGDEGEGRLAEIPTILEAVMAEVMRARDLAGVGVLVTAGPTYEPIDAVRFIGNRSSGKTGYCIAEEAARRGAEVILVSGPTTLADPFGVQTIRVQTSEEMRAAAMEAFARVDAVIATAAVADIRPRDPIGQKIKKRDFPEVIPIESTPDILAGMAVAKGDRIVIGFAAESENLLVNARKKLEQKSLDLVVGNDITVEGRGFGADVNEVVFVTPDDHEWVPVTSKRTIARLVCDRLCLLVARRVSE